MGVIDHAIAVLESVATSAEILQEYNPNHDGKGRFAKRAGGGGGPVSLGSALEAWGDSPALIDDVEREAIMDAIDADGSTAPQDLFRGMGFASESERDDFIESVERGDPLPLSSFSPDSDVAIMYGADDGNGNVVAFPVLVVAPAGNGQFLDVSEHVRAGDEFVTYGRYEATVEWESDIFAGVAQSPTIYLGERLPLSSVERSRLAKKAADARWAQHPEDRA